MMPHRHPGTSSDSGCTERSAWKGVACAARISEWAFTTATLNDKGQALQTKHVKQSADYRDATNDTAGAFVYLLRQKAILGGVKISD